MLIHFARFGPYHLTRISSAAAALESTDWRVVGLETGGGDATYAWREETGEHDWERVTVFPGEAAESIEAPRLKRGVASALDDIRPEAVAIAGWGTPDARECLNWCRRNGARAIVMSETREADGRRIWWKELLKARIIRRFDGALVGGRSHRDYLVKLGMPAEKIRLGYNVVDNGYFAREVATHRGFGVSGGSVSRKTVSPYFLASNRFIERKNLMRLVEAFARFRASAECQAGSDQWNLCLLGDGQEKSALVAKCREAGLQVVEKAPWEADRNPDAPKPRNTVYFPGFRQIDELPRFYAHAGCFVHPALEEPWGLVINEAMAAGLPVLSGENVGAAEELIDEGVNGWTFEAGSVDAIAEGLGKLARLSEDRRRKMGAASAEILQERCPTEAFGRGLAELLQGEG